MRLEGKRAYGVIENFYCVAKNTVRLRAARDKCGKLYRFQVRNNFIISHFKEFEDNLELLNYFKQRNDLIKFAF